MTVSSYLFQNPYSQAVQVGRPDPQMLAEQNKEQQEQLNTSQQENSAMMQKQNGSNLEQMMSKSSLSYSSDAGYQDSISAIEKLSQAAQNTNRAENIRTYIE